MPHRIDLVPAAAAEDPAVRDRVAEVVNAAYAIGEAGMWRPGTDRVTAEDAAGLIRASEVLAAETDGEVVGCVRAHELDEREWGLGMLAVDPRRQSGGLGGALVDAAEDRAREHGAHAMRLEILAPRDVVQDSKVRLRAWYARRGYRLVGHGALEDDHPQLLPLLAVPCTYEVWRKALDA